MCDLYTYSITTFFIRYTYKRSVIHISKKTKQKNPPVLPCYSCSTLYNSRDTSIKVSTEDVSMKNIYDIKTGNSVQPPKRMRFCHF